MPRSTRPRKAYRPHTVATNAALVAVNNVQKLRALDVAGQVANLQGALDQFRRGQRCLDHWCSLADCANVTETLATMGLGSGGDAWRVIQQAQRVLADVRQRQARVHTWALRHDEADALAWLISLHATQLQACDYSEFCRALDRTHRRIAQARAGNAPAGAVVVLGQIA